ncbi:family 43 glycosylhydrolase [Paenibacillus silvisoli]|uniref:family 43 glycosylhydrolase n=1 Tax=Paenibacillus silvisoli TaxID=3110539 RepID=UPI0028044BE4|nr:family 43 glycosylhydrolase [Paenibacillus silvisoli]
MRKTTLRLRFAAGCLLAVIAIAAAIGMGRDWMKNSTHDSFVYQGHGGTFKNTLAEIDTPDPSVVYHDGYYYMTFTHNGADVMVMKSRKLDFRGAQRQTVWIPPMDTAYSANVWAPEIQRIDGKWYIYFAADNGQNENHRMYVLQADSDDPMGAYTFKGQVTDETNKWAIDGLAMEHEGKLYFVWSGWEGDVNVQQNTYIAPMSDPLTISGPRVLLNEPTLDWEKAGGPPYINEGQAILKKDGRLFIVYSGAGSWTPYYALGMLALKPGADPLHADSWSKSDQPLLQMDEEAGVFGPGHNSFVCSQGGSEDCWIVYHATTGRSDGWGNRKARAQKIRWNEEGLPEFGSPLSLETAIPVPSGSGLAKAEYAKRAGSRIEFDFIESTLDGEAPLLIHYRQTSGDKRTIDLHVNGQQAADAIEVPATAANETGYLYVQIPLVPGLNTVSLPANFEGLDILAVEVPRYEAENAQTSGEAAVTPLPFTSGWGAVQLPGDAASALRFANIAVPRDGKYKLRFAVSNNGEQPASLKITLDGDKPQTVEAAPTGRNEYALAELEVDLQAGVHEIKIESANGRLFVDYLDVYGL